MKTTSIPIYRKAKEGKVLLAMTLDHRNGTDKAMPVCVRIGIGTLRRYFLMPGERYTLEEFSSIIKEDNRKQGRKRKEFDDFFEKMKREVKQLVGDGELSPSEFMERLRANMNGLKKEAEAKGKTIYDVWEEVLSELEDAGRLGTRNSYQVALKRFKQDMGEKVNNAAIVLQGTEAKPLSNISFRNVVVKECKIGFSSMNTEPVVLQNCHIGGQVTSAPSTASKKDKVFDKPIQNL